MKPIMTKGMNLEIYVSPDNPTTIKNFPKNIVQKLTN